MSETKGRSKLELNKVVNGKGSPSEEQTLRIDDDIGVMVSCLDHPQNATKIRIWVNRNAWSGKVESYAVQYYDTRGLVIKNSRYYDQLITPASVMQMRIANPYAE